MSQPLHVTHWGGEYSRSLAVAAVGAWNGLASNPYQLWALRRAEMTAFVNSPFKNLDGNPTPMAQVRQLEPRSFGAERMVTLLKLGMQDLLNTLRALPSGFCIAVSLCLPERMSSDRATQRDRRCRALLEYALEDCLVSIGMESIVQVVARGHAAGVFGTLQAADVLLNGITPLTLVVAIDSYYDPFVMQQLLDEDRILDAGHLDAMVPGEGFAFSLITTSGFAKQCNLPILAYLYGAAVNFEPAAMNNDVACLGLGLSRPAVALGHRLKQEKRKLDWWISDMTPEGFRVEEFSLAWPRASRDLMDPHSTLEFLHTELGDLGAATIPTGMAIATEGFLRGDPKARNCMMTASSCNGDRGVVILEQSPTGARG